MVAKCDARGEDRIEGAVCLGGGHRLRHRAAGGDCAHHAEARRHAPQHRSPDQLGSDVSGPSWPQDPSLSTEVERCAQKPADRRRFGGGLTDLAIVAERPPCPPHHARVAILVQILPTGAAHERKDQRPHDRTAEAVGGVGMKAVLQLSGATVVRRRAGVSAPRQRALRRRPSLRRGPASERDQHTAGAAALAGPRASRVRFGAALQPALWAPGLAYGTEPVADQTGERCDDGSLSPRPDGTRVRARGGQGRRRRRAASSR